jgi:MFS family permease
MIYGFGGLFGTFCGGQWASRAASQNERLQLQWMAVGYCSFGVLSVALYLCSSQYFAFALLAIAVVGQNMVTGPLFATIQTLVPHRMRATSVAIIYLFANLIGMGLGPLAAGALSDAFRPFAGEQSLRYALLILSPGYLWGGWHLWAASRTVMSDLQAVETARATLEPGGASLPEPKSVATKPSL